MQWFFYIIDNYIKNIELTHKKLSKTQTFVWLSNFSYFYNDENTFFFIEILIVISTVYE